MKKPELVGLIRQHIVELGEAAQASGRRITLEEWKVLTLNSYERFYLFEFLTNEALIHVVKNHLYQCTEVHTPVTYQETLIAKLLPELLTRFSKMQGV
jgi:hypothetical protein